MHTQKKKKSHAFSLGSLQNGCLSLWNVFFEGWKNRNTKMTNVPSQIMTMIMEYWFCLQGLQSGLNLYLRFWQPKGSSYVTFFLNYRKLYIYIFEDFRPSRQLQITNNNINVWWIKIWNNSIQNKQGLCLWDSWCHHIIIHCLWLLPHTLTHHFVR